MVVSGSRSVRYWVFVIVTAMLLAMPSIAEAKKKKKNPKKKGAAVQVNVNVKVNAGKGKGKGKKAKGKRGGKRRAFARNNDVLAVDEAFDGAFDDRFGRRGRGRGRFRVVRLNDGRLLDIAQDENGNLFPVRAGALGGRGGVANPTVSNPDGDILTAEQLLSPTPLQPIGRGQLLSGSDSRGQRLPENVVQSIQLYNSGGRPEE